MTRFAVNELARYIVIIAWMGINTYLFVSAFITLNTTKPNFYLRLIVKDGLAFARASAAVLNFNCMLILLTMCRNLLSSIRGLGCGHSVLRLLDKHKTFHKYIAYMICLQTAIHIVAHVFNVEFFIDSYKSKDRVIQTLNNMADIGNETYLNPIRNSNTVPVVELWKLASGITGAVITLCLILMVSSSTELIRRSYFEVFWYNHHLFVIFYAGLVLHGIQGVVRFQSNVEEHDPEVCSKNLTLWNTEPPCKVLPKFVPFGMNTWKWVAGPIVLYIIERFIRFYRSFQDVKILKVVNHPSKVIEIQMKKAGFHHDAGQYIFLKCPKLSHLEWHPFTLTSAPEDDFFSVHIRIAGDWTGALAKLFSGDEKETRSLADMPRLAVDGPFGTASSDVFKYPVCMCIGAGIGVTPFASVLKSIWYQHNQNNVNPVVKKVYFFWICPDTNAFEWFTDLLQYLEDRVMETFWSTTFTLLEDGDQIWHALLSCMKMKKKTSLQDADKRLAMGGLSGIRFLVASQNPTPGQTLVYFSVDQLASHTNSTKQRTNTATIAMVSSFTTTRRISKQNKHILVTIALSTHQCYGRLEKVASRKLCCNIYLFLYKRRISPSNLCERWVIFGRLLLNHLLSSLY